MKKLIIISGVIALIYACSGNTEKKESAQNSDAVSEPVKESSAPKESDPKGIGKFKDVDLSPSLNASMAKTGNDIYLVKYIVTLTRQFQHVLRQNIALYLVRSAINGRGPRL